MSLVKQIIQNIFSNKIVSYKITHFINHLSELNTKTNHIFISIEKENKNRMFYYFTIEELMILYKHCPPVERTLYELIFPTNIIKTYVDFEYYVDNNIDIKDKYIGATCFLKILHCALDYFDGMKFENSNFINRALQRFLVLET